MTHEPMPGPKSARARLLLPCGIAAGFVYVATDLAAAALYPGYSYMDQAVSELFAIGAPTARLVVPLFTLSSLLLLLFALGIASVARGRRALRLLALLFAASALTALALWTLFPMHVRGAEKSFTDTMHLILATNPFVLATLVAAAIAFGNGFRLFTIGTFVLILGLAAFGFHYAPALGAGEATPGMGLSERAAQYLYEGWQMGLALMLLRQTRDGPTVGTLPASVY